MNIKLQTRYAMTQGVLIAALSYILVTSCGPLIQNSYGEDGVDVDPAFLEHLGSFEAEWGRRVTRMSIQFDDNNEIDKDNNELAFCQPALGRIVIDPQWFWEAEHWSRELHIYHELGHCALRRPHRGGMFKKKFIPRSLMHPAPSFGLNEAKYRRYRSYYMRELFGRLGK